MKRLKKSSKYLKNTNEAIKLVKKDPKYFENIKKPSKKMKSISKLHHPDYYNNKYMPKTEKEKNYQNHLVKASNEIKILIRKESKKYKFIKISNSKIVIVKQNSNEIINFYLDKFEMIQYINSLNNEDKKLIIQNNGEMI